MFIFMPKEECIKSLRQLEVDAYSVLVSALRAQGALTDEKRKVMHDVSKALHISPDRHKCEVRRAVNDEKLNTIACHLTGPGVTCEDWIYEGRRQFPVLQRISPQTLRPIITPIDEKIDIESISVEIDNIETSKRIPETGQILTVVSGSETSSTPSSSILHKTLSVPFGKVTKLNMDKFKIVSAKQTIMKSGKKIIPLSQLRMLNHKLGMKGSIRVLPINGKVFGKNITMTRIANRHELKPFVERNVTEEKNESEIGKHEDTESVQVEQLPADLTPKETTEDSAS